MQKETKLPQFIAGFDLKGIAITLVVVFVVVAFGVEFIADSKDDATAQNQTEAAAIYDTGLTTMDELVAKTPTVVKVIVLAMIIAVLSIVGAGMSRRR